MKGSLKNAGRDIALYNEHKITGGGFIAPMAVGSMPEEKRPASCIGCRSCEQADNARTRDKQAPDVSSQGQQLVQDSESAGQERVEDV